MSTLAAPAPLKLARWRTPTVLIAIGCVIALIAFGPRSTLGQFLSPLSFERGWGREAFSLAIAIQNLLWGAAQPFAGAVADRFGPMRVICVGAILYATGLAWMAQATTLVELNLSAGVLIGFGLAGCSFPMVIGALGKLVPENWRGFAFGAGTAAGSFGQFLYSPLAAALIHAFSWQTTLTVFAGTILLVLPLSLALAMPQPVPARRGRKAAVVACGAHRSLRPRELRAASAGLLHLRFPARLVTVHLPSYLVDRGLGADAGAWTIGLIGLFNIIGSLSAGWLSGRMPKRYLLSIIYFGRAVAIVGLITLPQSTVAVLLFGAVTGLFWLSTVPPTSSLVALMFGTRWLAMLFGFAFFSHQVGGFLGVWLGGWAFEVTGSYDVVWWLSVFFGVASALINLPIVEKPVTRLEVAR